MIGVVKKCEEELVEEGCERLGLGFLVGRHKFDTALPHSAGCVEVWYVQQYIESSSI